MTDKLPELREIQLIAADIDGNMTDPDNIIVIPPRLLRLIAQARKERGIKVIGITGRTHPGIEGPTVETSISGFTSFDAWVTESGGIMGTFAGESDYLYKGNAIAGTPKVFGQMVNLLAPFAK